MRQKQLSGRKKIEGWLGGMELQFTAHTTTWSTTPMCPWGNIHVHGGVYQMFLTFGMFSHIGHRTYCILEGASFSKC